MNPWAIIDFTNCTYQGIIQDNSLIGIIWVSGSVDTRITQDQEYGTLNRHRDYYAEKLK